MITIPDGSYDQIELTSPVAGTCNRRMTRPVSVLLLMIYQMEDNIGVWQDGKRRCGI